MKSGDKLPGGGALAQRVNDALRAEFVAAGRGSIARTQRRMGVSDAYFRNLRPEALTFATLGAALDALEVDQSHFFSKVFASELDPVEQFRRTLGKDDPAELPIVRRFREQLAKGGRSAEVADDEEESIEDLDARRFDAPDEVARLATARIGRGGGADELIGLLGVWASAQRSLGHGSSAASALVECVDSAEQVGSVAGKIQAVRRAAVLTRIETARAEDHQLLSGALFDATISASVSQGMQSELSRSLVSRVKLIKQQKPAMRSLGQQLEVVLDNLPQVGEGSPIDTLGWTTVAAELAFLWLHQGRSDQALDRFYEIESAIAPTGGAWLAACQHNLAIALGAVGRLEAAQQFFEKSIVLFDGRYLSDLLASTANIARCMVWYGGFEVAKEVVELAVPKLTSEPLVGSQRASQARALQLACLRNESEELFRLATGVASMWDDVVRLPARGSRP